MSQQQRSRPRPPVRRPRQRVPAVHRLLLLAALLAASSLGRAAAQEEPAAPAAAEALLALALEGTVSDRFGEPAAERAVELRDAADAVVAATVTAGDGSYRLVVRTSLGDHLLVARDGERIAAELSLSLGPLLDGAVLRRDLRLRPAQRAGAGATAEAPYHTVEVFYATDRAPTGDPDPRRRYSGRRRGGEALELGTATVTVPRDHRLGTFETPSIWRLELAADPARHLVLASVTPQPADAFYRAVGARVGRSARREVFVYVHGFLTSWEDAVRSTAQLTYDLQLDAAPIAYTWPAGESLLGYTAAEATAEWSTAHLTTFLRDLAGRTGATSIHVVAHSMGTRVVTGAMQRLVACGDAALPPLNQVVLAAPDMDAAVFRQLAGELATAGRRVTLYASSNDQALVVSRKLHAYPRAGSSGEELVVAPGIETVDVSEVDSSLLGHFYYLEEGSVVMDLHALLRSWAPAEQRRHLRDVRAGALRFWKLLRAVG